MRSKKHAGGGNSLKMCTRIRISDKISSTPPSHIQLKQQSENFICTCSDASCLGEATSSSSENGLWDSIPLDIGRAFWNNLELHLSYTPTHCRSFDINLALKKNTEQERDNMVDEREDARMQGDETKKKNFYRKVIGVLSAVWNMSPDSKKPTKQALREILHQRQLSHWNHMDEVYPGIFVGDETAAKDAESLKRVGITHVLNASYVTSVGTPLGVNTSAQFYQIRSFRCEFLGIPALDIMGFKINRFFDQAADFIESALNSNGKVLVHCYMGVSRSASLVIAYLIIKKNMSAVDALKQLRSARNVYPNDGFLDQICELEAKVSKQKQG